MAATVRRKRQADDVRILQGDCLEVMPSIESASVDLILCDLPYGTTACAWDTVIPFEPLWEQYRRIIKPNGAIVLTASQPFTSALVTSNPKWFRYEWIWEKTHPKGHLNAKKAPMRAHENILVFYSSLPTYNPLMTHGHIRKIAASRYVRDGDGKSVYGKENRDTLYDSTQRYPRSVQVFSNGDQTGKLHRTQKPVALMEYLIRTYTNPGELVLDNCFGSGTTLLAAFLCGRRAIGIELNPDYCEIARSRIDAARMERKAAA